MSSQLSIMEEIKEQRKKAFATMSFQEKLAYFWDYYKVHTIAAVLAVVFIIGFVSSYLSNKPYAFYAALLNADTHAENNDTSVTWAQEFLEYAGIDPDSYQVMVDTSIAISSGGGDQYEMANRQKMAAMMQIGDIHAILADTETFEGYARLEYFYDLTATFTEEELAPYAGLFYYTDAAAFNDDSGNTLEEMDTAKEKMYAQVIDHSDPSSMEKPVAVGIRIPKTGNKLADAGYYTYLEDSHATFQGYPSETVMGIPVSAENPALALQFLSYLCDSE